MSKKTKRKIFLCIVYIGLLGYGGYTVLQQQYQLADLNRNKTELSRKVELEQQKNEQLNADKENANSDEMVEKIAREKLGLIRADEKIFVDSSR